MDNFMANASSFIRNPLGIIGLFVSLIYGFGSLVLTVNNGLDKHQTYPLIWFLVFFPLIVLLAFVYLVVFHHKKLYGPGDYKDERNFVITHASVNNNQEKMEKQLDVTVEIDESEKEIIKKETNFDLANVSTSGDNKINLKTLVDNVVSDTAKGIQEQYEAAETQVLDKLELELKIPIKRQAAINFEGQPSILLDGIGETEREIIFIEVKYPQFGLIGPAFKRSAEKLINQIMIINSSHFKEKKATIIFAIAVKAEFRDILEKRLEKTKSSLNLPNKRIEFKIIEIE